MVLASLSPARERLNANQSDTEKKPRIQAGLLTDRREGFRSVSNNQFFEINHSLYAVALKLGFVLT